VEDQSFLFTIGLILLVSLAGGWLRARRKDDCLKDFEGYHVTMELINNKLIWGWLDLTPTGFELHYQKGVHDDNHLENSYVFYGQEYAQIHAIYRYADQLNDKNRLRREKEIENAFRPGPLRRWWRRLLNFVRTATEALNEVLGLMIGRARRPGGRYISDKGETYLKQLGGNMIGHVGSDYDPLLERFIGMKVVMELAEEGVLHEHVGIFRQYSADFLEFLDVQFPDPQAITLNQPDNASHPYLMATVMNGSLLVENHGKMPVWLDVLRTADDEQPLDVIVDSGESVVLRRPFPYEQATLQVRVVRELDMIVPRTQARIRHRAEYTDKEALTDIVFDLGVALVSDDKQTAVREQRLRERLEANSVDAMAAANLGALLLRQRELDEAEKWLCQAQKMYRSLPDNGRTVSMHLRELRRRRRGIWELGADRAVADDVAYSG
jgi:tetratricopeptide (TPR) repeat protein